MEELHSQNVFDNNPEKQWHFFSDQILDFVETRKIESKLFETVIRNGVDEIDESLFQKHYKITKREIKSILARFYKKKDGHFYLQEGISPERFMFIDDLLKFIRGTTTGGGAFDQSEIEEDFLKAITRFTKKYRIDTDLESIKRKMQDVVVCILCLLHNSNFKLFDGKIGKCYLGAQKDQATGIYLLGLIVNTENFIFHVISTSIDVRYYVSVKEEQMEEYSTSAIPWCVTERDVEGRLRLTPIA
jgi:hypothetical protein